MSIAERLRAAREAKSEPQRVAAGKLGVTERTYMLWERGGMAPGVDKYRDVARYCGVSVGVILHDLGVLDDVELQRLTRTDGPKPRGARRSPAAHGEESIQAHNARPLRYVKSKSDKAGVATTLRRAS